jgi:hypothetical protein
MNVRAKAAPWLDRDQPKIVTKKFQLLLAGAIWRRPWPGRICAPRRLTHRRISTAHADAASARERTFVGFALDESRLQRPIRQAERRPDMGHRSDQKRPLPRCPYLRDVNRGLKTANDQNHEKSFHRFSCHVSIRIFGVPCSRSLLGQAVSCRGSIFPKISASSARHSTAANHFDCFFR